MAVSSPRVPTPAAVPPRSPGRPRSGAADAAILGAARELLAAAGWDGFSVEGVAALAGVAKTTVYRRWSSKTDLAIGAVAELMAAAHPDPGTSAADDIRQALRAHADVLSRPEARAAYLAVVAEAARDDMLRARFDDEVLGPGRAMLVDGLARAVARGEVPPDLDVDFLHDMLAGPLVHRVLVRGSEADDAFIEALIAVLMRWADDVRSRDDAPQG